MLGELTTYERRKEYYTNIQLGKDFHTQTNLLQTQTKALIAAQATTANSIITSNETIKDEIDNLACSMDDVKQGLYGLKSAFEFGISEVVWQIEQNRKELQNILSVLIAPLDTQSKELRRRAEDAYANGWFDEALEDFLESEKKNKYDFAVHISLGMLYLFQKVDRQKAAEYFEKAIKYAKPKSLYHASFALLHAALIKRDLNLLSDAENLTEQAVELTPEFAEALYQNSQYNAQMRNASKSLLRLEKAIQIDQKYCLKANSAIEFDPIRNDVNTLFERLRNDSINRATSLFEEYTSALKNFNDIITSVDDNNVKLFKTEIDNIKRLISLNSYFDSLKALDLLEKFSSDIKEYVKDIEGKFANSIKTIDNEISNFHSETEDNATQKRGISQVWFGGIGFVIACIVGFRSCANHYHSEMQLESKGFVEGIGSLFSGTIGSLALLVLIVVVGTAGSIGLGWIFGSVMAAGDSSQDEINRLNNEKNDINNALQEIHQFLLT